MDLQILKAEDALTIPAESRHNFFALTKVNRRGSLPKINCEGKMYV